MQTDYTISVMTEDPTTSFLENGFLKCCVTQLHAPFDSRSFIYCLDCCKLGSPSWFAYHKESFVFDRSEESLAIHRNRFSRYVEDISSDVDLMNDEGKLFKLVRKVPPSLNGPQAEATEQPIVAPYRRLEPSFCSTQCGHGAAEEDPDEDGQPDCEESDIFHRTLECLTECFEKFCFLNRSFTIHPSSRSLKHFSPKTL